MTAFARVIQSLVVSAIDDGEQCQRPHPGYRAARIGFGERRRSPHRLLDLEERPRLPDREAETFAHVAIYGREPECAIELVINQYAKEPSNARLSLAKAPAS